MGGEDSPFKNIKGAEIFSRIHPEVNLKLFGIKDLILENILKT